MWWRKYGNGRSWCNTGLPDRTWHRMEDGIHDNLDNCPRFQTQISSTRIHDEIGDVCDSQNLWKSQSWRIRILWRWKFNARWWLFRLTCTLESLDTDNDGLTDKIDNCPTLPNPHSARHWSRWNWWYLWRRRWSRWYSRFNWQLASFHANPEQNRCWWRWNRWYLW